MGKDIADNPSRGLFNYSLTHLSQKDKVRFYYALKGRDGKTGIVKQYKIENLAKGILLVPETANKDVINFLTLWKCKYTQRKVRIEP